MNHATGYLRWVVCAACLVAAPESLWAQETLELPSRMEPAPVENFGPGVAQSYAPGQVPLGQYPTGQYLPGQIQPGQAVLGQPMFDPSCGPMGCPMCGTPSGCECKQLSCPGTAAVPRVALYLFSSIDVWRGLPDGSFPSNFGGAQGINVGAALPWLEELGIGGQLGASYGTYDLDGRFTGSPHEIQQQTFVTAGLFRRATPRVPIAGGVVYDAMINDSFGEYAVSPYLSQFRGQLAFVANAWNEFGVWGTVRDRGASKTVGGVQLNFRGIDQLNIFWHHKFGSGGGESWVYAGIPEKDRLDQSPGLGGSLGTLILGTSMNVPITDSLAVFFDGMYMKPSARPSAAASIEDAYNLSAGIMFYPGRTARSATVAGRAWMPYLPVANNGRFMVDTNHVF
jgi:hypothetical protein